MIVRSLEIYRYSIPFLQPILFGEIAHSNRVGFVVALHSANGKIGWGEIAPLPFFSNESEEEALSQLRQLSKDIKRESWDIDEHDVLQSCTDYLQNDISPSVAFGVESGLLHLGALYNDTIPATMLSADYAREITVNSLIFGDRDSIIQKAKERIADGFQTMKVKIGRDSLENDVALIKSIRAEIGPKIQIRLDANRRYDIATARSLFDQIADCAIEYIEEPVRDYLELMQLCQETVPKVAIALDESLRSISPQSLIHLRGVTTVILKPMLLSLTKSLLFASKGKEVAMNSVISSSFETSLGLSMLSQLSSVTSYESKKACGLDTLSALNGDIVTKPLTISNGMIDVTTAFETAKSLNMSTLRRITDE